MINLDTHILLFALTNQLTASEKNLIDSESCGISHIVLWEITNLYLLNRINIGPSDPAFDQILRRLNQWPVSIEVCRCIGDLDFDSDPADEIIAATSLAHDVPLLTRDKKIRASKKVKFA